MSQKRGNGNTEQKTGEKKQHPARRFMRKKPPEDAADRYGWIAVRFIQDNNYSTCDLNFMKCAELVRLGITDEQVAVGLQEAHDRHVRAKQKPTILYAFDVICELYAPIEAAAEGGAKDSGLSSLIAAAMGER